MGRVPTQDQKAGLREVRIGPRGAGGRYVTAYDPAVALRVCERLAEGETLKAICTAPKEGEEGWEVGEDGEPKPWPFPARQTFHRWVVNHAELARAYAAARELSAHSMEEEAVDMARALVKEPGNAQKVRAYDVAMNQLRWSASKRNPRVFSERGAVSFVVPIQINTTLDLGEGGAATAKDYPDIYTVEATVVQEIEGDKVGEIEAGPLIEDKPWQKPEPAPPQPKRGAGRPKGAAGKSKFLRGLEDVKLVVGGKEAGR
jgi:hypothetical protein